MERESSLELLSKKILAALLENVNKDFKEEFHELNLALKEEESLELLLQKYLKEENLAKPKRKLIKKLLEQEIRIRDFSFQSGFEEYFHLIPKIVFQNCRFKSLNFEEKTLFFKKCEFDLNLPQLRFYNCIIESEFVLKDKIYLIDEVDFSESTFNLQCKIENCRIKKSAKFINTKFNRLGDFYKTTFNEVNFERADFNHVAVFTATLFNQDLNFKYTKFGEKSVFSQMIVKGKLNLKDAIFEDSAKFLEVSSNRKREVPINVANRETARIIKDFYEKSNNIIEANRFYALEMKEREKELTADKWANFSEYIIFKIHAITSNHSQDWLLTLYWIIIVSFIYVNLKNFFESSWLFSHAIFYFALLLIISDFFIKYKRKLYQRLFRFSIILILLLSYQHSSQDFYLTQFSKSVNPSLIIRYKEDMNLLALIYKIIITYLVYQLIISIRQNTRRK